MEYELVTDRYGNPMLWPTYVTLEELQQLCRLQGWEDTLRISGETIVDNEGIVAIGETDGKR